MTQDNRMELMHEWLHRVINASLPCIVASGRQWTVQVQGFCGPRCSHESRGHQQCVSKIADAMQPCNTISSRADWARPTLEEGCIKNDLVF